MEEETQKENQIVELTILMPCLNEASNIGFSVAEAKQFLSSHGINGEVLVVDNNSQDASAEIAKKQGARVVTEKKKGYGNALRCGIAQARGTYIIMGDCDSTYPFDNLMPFVKRLREGYIFVMGNRFAGKIEKKAMPFSHRYIGIPFLSLLGRIRYRVPIRDFHCGLRGFDATTAKKLNFQTTGMEFATEIIARFSKETTDIAQVPVDLRVSRAKRKPHLHAFRDGLRHIRFMLTDK